MCVPAVAVGINWSSSSNADVDFSRWCISAYPAVARDQLLRVISGWYVSCDDQRNDSVLSAVALYQLLVVTDLCCSDFVVAAACGNCGSGAGEGAQSSQSSQSAPQPSQQQQQQLAQQSGRRKFRPRGHQFKKKSGSGSSGSGSSSSSGSREEFCGFCGGKHPSTQSVGVQGSCNICGQYGHFARVCPSAGSQQAAAPPQGRGGSSRGRSPQFPQPRVGETQFRPFQLPGPSRFGQSSHKHFSGPQHAQANDITREQAEGAPSGVIAGNCSVFDFPARVFSDTGASHSFISDAFVVEHGLHTFPLRDVVSVSTPGGASLYSQEVLVSMC
ncbi:hypothetical protein F511_21168 [Dorcoceras hygrometricum]|uniref:CCHC-type domain-containing protein n=1 Tax=Dorcoceras hygrometricum TaxID=472368 RepID=A0A2Z7DJR0_9LAMI|nr:hypothetical protein F511_21168 [Dorcoceras hygrometricum]